MSPSRTLYISDYLNILKQGSLRRGHPKNNIELPISTRTDSEVVNTGKLCGSNERRGHGVLVT